MESNYCRWINHQYSFYDREMGAQDLIDRYKYWQDLRNIRFVCVDPAICILLLIYFILWSLFYLRVLIKEGMAHHSKEPGIFIQDTENKKDIIMNLYFIIEGDASKTGGRRKIMIRLFAFVEYKSHCL